MDKLKVLHIVLNFGTGGVEKAVVDMLLNYSKDSFEMSVVSLLPRNNNIFEKVLDDAGVNVIYLKMLTGLFDVRIPYKLNIIMKQLKPDVLHVHLFMTKYVFIPAVANNIPVRIHTVHVPAHEEVSGIWSKVQEFAYKKCAFTPVAVSDSVRESLITLHKLDKVRVIYNGIDIDKFKKEKPKTGEDGIINLINVARFMPPKNHRLLVEAFNILTKYYSNVRLKLAGDGLLMEDIRQMVMDMGFEDKVDFLGVRSDIPDLLVENDIFVLSSNYEGFGLALVEAMAAGLPVVSTRVGGVPEVIIDGENGLLTEPDNPNELAEAISKLIDDKSLRDRIGSTGKKYADKFDLRNTVHEYEKLYKDLYLNRMG